MNRAFALAVANLLFFACITKAKGEVPVPIRNNGEVNNLTGIAKPSGLLTNPYQKSPELLSSFWEGTVYHALFAYHWAKPIAKGQPQCEPMEEDDFNLAAFDITDWVSYGETKANTVSDSLIADIQTLNDEWQDRTNFELNTTIYGIDRVLYLRHETETLNDLQPDVEAEEEWYDNEAEELDQMASDLLISLDNEAEVLYENQIAYNLELLKLDSPELQEEWTEDDDDDVSNGESEWMYQTSATITETDGWETNSEPIEIENDVVIEFIEIDED